MTGKCLFSAPYSFFPQSVLADYQQVLPTTFREIWDRSDLQPDSTITAWVMNPGQRFVITADVLDLFPNLEVLVTPSTGTNHIDRQVCEARGLPVFGLLDDKAGLNTISASAEFTFLLLLNTLRRLDIAIQEVKEGRWRHREDALRGNELSGKRVGLVGYGRIGKRLARWCTSFDAQVRFYDPYVDDQDFPRLSLEEIFSTSDVVCICPTLTAETRGIINQPLLASLPPNACLVNTSRGEVVDEAALVAVLQARPDLRVGLDVLPGEVTNTHLASPLIELHRQGRIVVTPHIAGATVESQSKAALLALGLLKRYLETP
jgi:phosphoglycerate dehydrogenase-like enzyme